MILSVVGSYSYDAQDRIIEELDKTLDILDISMITNDGYGKIHDILIEYTRKRRLKFETFKKEGRDQFLHHKRMVDHSDILIAFWDGSCKSTKKIIMRSLRMSKMVRIIKI